MIDYEQALGMPRMEGTFKHMGDDEGAFNIESSFLMAKNDSLIIARLYVETSIESVDMCPINEQGSNEP